MKTWSTSLILLILAISAHGAEGSAKPVAPSDEPAYELPTTGVNQPRPNGGWINADMGGTRLVVKFFDEKKRPASPDVDRGLAVLRYSAKSPDRVPLHREGDTLVTPATVRPPHNFLLILSLFAGEEDEPVELHTFRYP